MCAGCSTPFGVPLRLISTRVLSAPSAVSFAVPVSPDLFCAAIFTVMLLPPLLCFFDSFLSCASATPEAAVKSTATINQRTFMKPPLRECDVEGNPWTGVYAAVMTRVRALQSEGRGHGLEKSGVCGAGGQPGHRGDQVRRRRRHGQLRHVVRRRAFHGG